jgi:hypothetical protein
VGLPQRLVPLDRLEGLRARRASRSRPPPGRHREDIPEGEGRADAGRRLSVPRRRQATGEVARITYDNFKDSVVDRPLHDAYLRVWSTMLDLQPMVRGRSDGFGRRFFQQEKA